MNSSLLAALIASGASTHSVPSAWREALVAAGAADGQLSTFLRQEGYSGSVADSFFKYLGDKGYIGSLSDRIAAASLALDLFSAPVTYAVWNPDDAGAGQTVTGDGLIVTATDTGWKSIRADLALTTGKPEFEVTVSGALPYHVIVGVGASSAVLSTFVGSDTQSCGVYAGQGEKVYGGSANPFGFTPWLNGVLTVSADLGTGVIKVKYNGATLTTLCSTTDIGTTVSGTYPIASVYGAGTVLTANFGSSPLLYSEAGYDGGWAA